MLPKQWWRNGEATDEMTDEAPNEATDEVIVLIFLVCVISTRSDKMK